MKRIAFFNFQNHLDRKVSVDFVEIDRLKLIGTSVAGYVAMGFSEQTAEILFDPRSEDVIPEALSAIHQTSDNSIFKSPSALEGFEKALSIKFDEFSMVLDAIALRANNELLKKHHPLLLGNVKKTTEIRKKHEFYIQAKIVEQLRLKRTLYKEFKPSDSEIEKMSRLNHRKTQHLTFYEKVRVEEAIQEGLKQSLVGIKLHLFCARKCGLFINQFSCLIENRTEQF
ncbi:MULTISPECIES: hypothetical protein [Vibrio]|uniref:hypothetical protein n=1 Tax=Vibrio TaxID=662 RepID=UPI000841EEFB|nr:MULTISPECIES: hypothetical protein [Vibrio]ODM56858.1 hypothetical protein BC455_18535 [Vibrio harveyi]USD58501.1 hypothetical protein J4N44_27800 [Vibrio sp. SCSIO 43155]